MVVQGTGVIARIAGTVRHPRATFAALVKAPTWAALWSLILGICIVNGATLLSTDVGRQAVVDERVRVIEGLGGSVSDAEYAALQARPPWWVYLTSGGRLLLTPPMTLLAAAGLWLVARLERAPVSMGQVLALAVHASIVLVIGQLVATPFHVVRESLTSPLNVAALLPGVGDGTLGARFFGTLDLFALWWAGLLALGLSVLTTRRFARYAWPMAGLFVGFAGLVAAIIAATGGA